MICLVFLVVFITACVAVNPNVEVPVPEEVVIDCVDEDGDGYGVGVDCKGEDCDDTNELVHPAMVDIPEDRIDNDCEGGDKLLPEFKDTDHDGLSDVEEEKLGLDKELSDTDGDGLYDLEELTDFLTDPLNADTDGDGFFDGCERTSETDPLDSFSTPVDEDGDGLDDEWERKMFSTVWAEPGLSARPYNDKDAANSAGRAGKEIGDGLNNMEEYCYGLNPMSSDTDKDMLEDGMEITAYYTDPNNDDTDGDGYKDGKEIYYDGTNPLDPGSHAIVSLVRNVGRSKGVRADSEGSYRPVATAIGQSVNTGGAERDV